jgi:hypothetical protein
MSHAFQRGQIRRRNVYTHSSATPLSLTEEQSGSLIFLDCSSPSYNLVVNLPPIAGSAGLNYEFLISKSLAGNTIKIHAKNKSGTKEAKLKMIKIKNYFNQTIDEGTIDGSTTADPGETVTFTVPGTAAKIGDKFEVISDGNIDGEVESLNAYWYLTVLQGSNTAINLTSLEN